MIQIIGTPQLRFTNDGRAILDVSQNLAPRSRDKTTGEWGQVGIDMWTRGSIWASESGPSPEAIMDACPPGWRVILQADSVRRSEYRDKSGQARVNDELQFPRFVGFQPPRGLVNGQTGVQRPTGAANSPAVGEVDPWTTQGPHAGAQAPTQAAPF